VAVSTPARSTGRGPAGTGGGPSPDGDQGGGEEDLYEGRLVVPRWVPITATIVCLLLVADSADLTYAHFTSAAVLSCPTHGFINCGLVTTSKYSHPLGVPVAVAGLVWSLGMLAICSPWAYRATSPWWGRLRIAGVIAGVLSVFYLLWAELIKLHHLCEYCTGVHVLTLVLFFVVLAGAAMAAPAGLVRDDD
jgi:uncharacterized membrane protein